MDQDNNEPLDYILIPMKSLPEAPLIVNEQALFDRFGHRFETVAELIRVLKRRLPVHR
jgi:hypothetical protein